jgi:hypothetical protein
MQAFIAAGFAAIVSPRPNFYRCTGGSDGLSLVAVAATREASALRDKRALG